MSEGSFLFAKYITSTLCVANRTRPKDPVPSVTPISNCVASNGAASLFDFFPLASVAEDPPLTGWTPAEVAILLRYFVRREPVEEIPR